MNPFEPGSSDSDDEDDEYYYLDVLRDGKQSLGLGKHYVPDWKPPHAIREYHQNWKDGIKETNHLTNREFKILDKGFNSKDVYTIEARHPDTDELLGFISWDNGTIQYTNFGAKLNRCCLNMGVSTKRDDDDLAGTHGEGFKVASLVMVRRGYHVRYEASKFYWKFYFGGRDKDVLYCKLREMKEGRLESLMKGFTAKVKRATPRELKANIWEDVTVRIGLFQGQGRRVEKADFLLWNKVSLDLDCPSNIIATAHGSVILDERFKGRIYLKGLFLEGKGRMPFKFCYNFNRGEVNRDRQRLSDPREEAETLAKIWAEAVRLQEALTLPHLLEMLQADEEWGDVNLAQDYMSKETAEKIWQRLQEENVGGEKFYYYGQDGDKDIELIVKSLQKDPAPLKKATWLSLRKFGLIHTPKEQRHHLLQNAPVTSVLKTSYSEDVERALRSVLALDSRTQALRLDFRSRDKAELDLLLQGSDLLINDKWLDFHSSHAQSSCSTFLEAEAARIDITRFSCGHIVKCLYDLILVELSKGSNGQHSRGSHPEDFLRQMASERIDQMPCMVHVDKGDIGGVLIVRWVHVESEKLSKIHSLELMGRVTMHRESTCANKKSELLTSIPRDQSSLMQEEETSIEYLQLQQLGECGCPEQIVSLKESEATFHGLSHEEEYFPMVARTDYQAFFALPPRPIRPDAPLINLPDRSSSARTMKPDEDASRSAPVQGGDFDDLYDISDGENDMDYNPSFTGSRQTSDSTTDSRSEDSRFEFINSSPKSQIENDMPGNGIDYELQHIRKLTAEVEMQKSSIWAKDQLLQGLETEVASLRSQFSVEKSKARQLEEDLDTHRKLLAVNEKELTEMKMHLAARSNDLEVNQTTFPALIGDEYRREQSTAEIERLHGLVGMLEDALHANEQDLQNSTSELNRLLTLIENLNEEIRKKDVELHAAQSSAPDRPDVDRATEATLELLQQQNRDLRRQKKELRSDLEQERENVRKALEIAATRVASRSTKRSRIKEESDEESDDLFRASNAALKRARQENVLEANANAQAVIELD